MTDRPITVREVEAHAASIAAMASALLTGLASGKYDRQAAFGEHVLSGLGLVFPPAAMVEKGIEVFLAINKMTAPRGGVIPDGRGGVIPKHGQSVYDPATGEFTGETT